MTGTLSKLRFSRCGDFFSRRLAWAGLLIGLASGLWVDAPAQAMRPRPSFAPVFEKDGGRINTFVPGPNGTYYAVGNFTSINGVRRLLVARFLADDSLDLSWTPAAVAQNYEGVDVLTAALDHEGRLVIGGTFGYVGGQKRLRLARLNADGSLDTGFETGSLFSNYTVARVTAIALENDNQIVVAAKAGSSYQYSSERRFARLNVNGSVDPTFVTGTGFDADSEILVINNLLGGKFLVGGKFTSYQGVARNSLVRLNEDGSLDTSFQLAPEVTGTVRSVLVTNDGKILVGGSFPKGLLRLNSDGSLDSTFAIGSGFTVLSGTITYGGVTSLAFGYDGKIVVGGDFNLIQSKQRIRLAVLQANGVVDDDFTGASPTYGAASILPVAAMKYLVISGGTPGRYNTLGQYDTTYATKVRLPGIVTQIHPSPGGKWIAAGQFDYVNGVARAAGIARLNPDGSLDATFNAVGGKPTPVFTDWPSVRPIAVQPDGKVVHSSNSNPGYPQGNIDRWNADGSIDQTFNLYPQSGGLGNGISRILRQTDGKIVAAVATSSILYRLQANGSFDVSRNLQTPLNYPGPALALQPDGKLLTGGSSSPRIARLNADFTVDSTFDPGTGFNGELRALAVQSDGKILAAGSFSAFQTTARSRVARLTASGALDDTFSPSGGPNGDLNALALTTDGKILVGGRFAFFNNIPRLAVVRLNVDGSVDTEFSVPSAIQEVNFVTTGVVMLHPTTDGGVLLAGERFDYTNFTGLGLVYLEPLAAPAITTPPLGLNRSVGQTASFSVVATGTAPLRYQWQRNGVDLPGETAPSLTIAAVQLIHAGSYRVIVTNDLAAVESAAVDLTLIPPASDSFAQAQNIFPVIDGSLVIGTNVLATTEAGEPAHAGNSGGKSVWWKWVAPSSGAIEVNTLESNFDTILAVYTGSSVSSLQPVAANDDVGGGTSGSALTFSATAGTTYYIAVGGKNGAEGSIRLVVGPAIPPTVTLSPVSKTLSARQSTTLSVTAQGSPALSYQWHRNGVAIAGATGPTLLLSRVGAADAGSYSVAVTNAAGSATGTAAVVRVAGSALATGNYHSLFVRPDGSVRATGYNSEGQIGDGTQNSRMTFGSLGVDVAAVAAGNLFSLLVKRDGSLWSCGDKIAIRLGEGDDPTRFLTPVKIATDVLTAAAGSDFILLVKTDGTLWAAGINGKGQLGNGTTASRAHFLQVASGVTAVAAGLQHAAFVKTDGTLWTVGWNANGQLGDGTTTDRLTAVQVATGVVTVAAGGFHTMFLKSDGTLWAMGRNHLGQLGDGTLADQLRPVSISEGVASMSAASFHSVFLKTDGTLWAMGSNEYGQLGNGSGAHHSTPAMISPNVVSATAYGHHTLFERADGTLWAMGLNTHGGLGDGTVTNRALPVLVGSMSGLSVATSSVATIFTEGSGAPSTPVPIDPALSLISDMPGLESAEISISEGLMPDQDALALPPDGIAYGNIAATYDAPAGVLTLSSAGATATISQWRTALRAVAYTNHSENPSGSNRRVTFVVKDGTAPSAVAAREITVLPVNDAPTGILLSSNTIVRSAGQNALVGTLTAVDPDSSTFSFTLTSGAGSTDNGLFNIVGMTLRANNPVLLPAGPFSVRILVNDGSGGLFANSFSLTATGISGGSFEAWRQTKFTLEELADPARSGPTAIYGHDSLPNLVKYALGLDPMQNATSSLPAVAVSAGEWTYTYTRPSDRSDVTYAVEVSTTLTSWTTSGVTHELVSTDAVAGTQTWRARYSLAGAANAFFRLKVESRTP